MANNNNMNLNAIFTGVVTGVVVDPSDDFFKTTIFITNKKPTRNETIKIHFYNDDAIWTYRFYEIGDSIRVAYPSGMKRSIDDFEILSHIDYHGIDKVLGVYPHEEMNIDEDVFAAMEAAAEEDRLRRNAIWLMNRNEDSEAC